MATHAKEDVILDQPVVPATARYVKLEILDVWEPHSKERTRSAIVRMFNIVYDPALKSAK